MTNINTFFTHFANKPSQPAPTSEHKKPKTEKEIQNTEIKDLLQKENDPLAKYPLRGFGYANEIGAAVSAMPGWGKAAETALWIPALMYLGADIYDKYSRGKEGDYSDKSVTKAVEQATFQALASVILPTAAVKMGQNLAAYATKYDGSKLTANTQEELYKKILEDFDKGKFAKSDYIMADGTVRKGFDRVMDKVLNEDFNDLLKDTKQDLKTEGVWSKVKRFFTHSKRPVSSAVAERTDVDNFLKARAKEIYELQTKLEVVTEDSLSSLDSKVQKQYRKAFKNIDVKADQLMKENPSFVLKKILNSTDSSLAPMRNTITNKYPGANLKVLLKDQRKCTELLNELMGKPGGKDIVTKFAKKIKVARDTLRPLIKGKEMKLGWLKTAGGFIALGCLAIPIDHFVHKYIIQKAVAPALGNVSHKNDK